KTSPPTPLRRRGGAKGSLGDPNEPTAIGNQMWVAPQRGMMSQSEGGYDWQPDVAAPQEKWYSVRGSGIAREGREGSYFDEEPLAYAEPGENIFLATKIPNGIAIRNPERQVVNTYYWRDNTLVPWETLLESDFTRNFPSLPDASTPTLADFPQQAYRVSTRPWGIPEVSTGADTDLPAGLWQSVSVLSGNGQGGTELLLGNWGLNSVLGNPSSERPLRLYEGDFDENGKVDPIITYVKDGREITVADKDELTSQLPGFRRNNLNYTDFANRTFSENFPSITVAPQSMTSLKHYWLYRSEGGGWSKRTLPYVTQIGPVNYALQIPLGTLLGGNKLEVLPRIGRQDAAALQLLRDDGSVEFIDLGGERNHLEVRQLISLDDRHILVVVAEGEHLILEVLPGGNS
ncbi:MAG: hypothetical protein AAF597_09185, partial [Bacteroidota bacterium]